MADQEGPKIIVDTDWKSQAHAEKERLAATEKARSPAPRPGGAPAAGPGSPAGSPGGAGAAGLGPEEHEIPKASFEELVRMLATQALLYLGAFPDPETGRRLVSLELAQFNIDMLSMLEEKTRGNLNEAEQQFITRMLAELRMQYVEISKAVQRAVEQGRMAPAGGVGGMGGPGAVAAGAGAVPPVSINPRPRA
ncbi:MAG: DUF1844 domain-containing protein [Phycisphaerales bacterium]